MVYPVAFCTGSLSLQLRDVDFDVDRIGTSTTVTKKKNFANTHKLPKLWRLFGRFSLYVHSEAAFLWGHICTHRSHVVTADCFGTEVGRKTQISSDPGLLFRGCYFIHGWSFHSTTGSETRRHQRKILRRHLFQAFGQITA